MIKHSHRKYVLLTALAIVFIGPLIMHSAPASALSGSQFNSGDIIDDSVFFNDSTMSADDIQAFLNAKVPTCDTNGSQMYNSTMTRAQYGAANGDPAPYTCLKDFTQTTPTLAAETGLCNGYNGGTQSAAQIIYNVSQSCGVNPEIILTLLQKEQSLVTDDWPWPTEYQSATGFGCPDTAACDTTYYGFFNQVYNAARIYKKYASDPTDFNYRAGRNNTIQYNPSASCGGSSIYIQNQATAGLYIYTPYQPDQAALDNLYGSGDSCSAYGNRNFWRFFNDWFGPSVGPLVRTATSGDLYYSDGITKYRVTSMELANEYGLGLSSVRIISQSDMDSLTTSTSTPYLTYILKSTSDSDADGGDIYLVSGGKRYLIPSLTMLSDFGYSTSQISYLDYSQLLRLPLAGNLSPFVKDNDTGTVFDVSGGDKQAIFDLATLSQLDPGDNVIGMSPYELDSIPVGTAIIDGNLVLQDSSGGIWLVIDNVWHYVSSMSTYDCLGLSNLANISFTPDQAVAGTQGSDASCITQSSTSGQKYIMDNWRRIPVDPSWGFSNFFVVPDTLLTPLVVYNPTTHPVFRTMQDGALYMLSGGQKRQVYSMSSFYDRGYVANDIFTSSSDFLSTIPTGSLALADGTVVRDSSNGHLAVIASDSKYYITSMDIFNAYGYNAANILTLPSAAVASYPALGNLSSQLAFAPGATVFDSGIALQIPASLDSAFGFVSGTTPTYLSGVAASGSIRQATRYLKFGSSPNLYYMENGTKRPVYSWDTFVALGGSNSNITGLSASAANLFPTGANE